MTPLEIEKFSSQLKPIIDVVEQKREEQNDKRERGELFNVFDAFRIDHDELAWSSFLATLLDPHGSHGCGDLFLRHFLQQFPYTPQNLDIKTATSNIEVTIGEIDKKNDYKSGGRIDILITDASKHAIIIENKIYAQDQYRQLYRYWKYATEVAKYESPCIIYLTLNGHKASPDSTKGLPNENYICMSYSQDVKKWLETCLEEISGEQKVTEIIKQFIQIIIKIGKEMKLDDEIKKAIESGFNMDDNLDNKIKQLSSILKDIPEMTNNVNLLLEQYQQDRFKEIIQKSSLLKELLPTEGKLNSYWCCRANIEHEEVKQIYVMHDWPQGMYCGIIFERADSDLWKNIEKECKMQPDKNNDKCLLYCTELNSYEKVYGCLKEVLKNLK